MKKGRPQIIALDVDDVLFDCLRMAVEEAQKRGCDVSFDQITDYHFGNLPKETGELLTELLSAGHEVIIASAVFPKLMSFRSKKLLHVLPNLNPRNIMLGARKDLLHVDFLLDDCLDNIQSSPAKYPVLFTQPWNTEGRDFMRVSAYQEFIQLVEAVSLAPEQSRPSLSKAGRPGLLCLVGPSASGKSFICDELVRNPIFEKVRAVTTRSPRPGEETAGEYVFATEAEFGGYLERGDLVESTVYNGCRYGITRNEIEEIWHKGKIAIKLSPAKRCMVTAAPLFLSGAARRILCPPCWSGMSPTRTRPADC